MLKWCKGCVWASDASGKTYCPWAAGMCVKLPSTMNQPDEDWLYKKIIREEYGQDPTENKESKEE